MAYSYSNQMDYYNQAQQGVHYTQSAKTSATPAVIGGALVGAAGGAIIGACKKTPINKHGEATDKFAKQVYEKSIGKESREIYNQAKNILKKIDKISTPEEFKKLINTNKKALTNLCANLETSLNDFIKNITDKNFKTNKKVIKDSLNLSNKIKYQNIKNQIQACWNSAEKKFQKVSGVKDEVFKQIKGIKNPTKGKLIAKYAGIGALMTGALAFIGIKIQSK